MTVSVLRPGADWIVPSRMSLASTCVAVPFLVASSLVPRTVTTMPSFRNESSATEMSSTLMLAPAVLYSMPLTKMLPLAVMTPWLTAGAAPVPPESTPPPQPATTIATRERVTARLGVFMCWQATGSGNGWFARDQKTAASRRCRQLHAGDGGAAGSAPELLCKRVTAAPARASFRPRCERPGSACSYRRAGRRCR